MFETRIYKTRRAELKTKISDGLILLLGNDESPMNYKGNIYPFRQDSTFLYYFGIDIPGMHGLIDVDSGEEILFGLDPGIEDVVWSGPQPALAEWALRSGVKGSKPISELEKTMVINKKNNRKIHILPPYREAHTKIISDLFSSKSISPSEE